MKESNFINFRDSKLTRLLQPSLCGNSKTAVICTINPINYQESINTLKFGMNAGSIRNYIKVNVKQIDNFLDKKNCNQENIDLKVILL